MFVLGKNSIINMGGIDDRLIDIVELLANDVKRVNGELARAFSWYKTVAPARKDAMMDMCFNMGLPRLKKFKKALAAMAMGDYNEAAIEFLDSRWSSQVGQRAITITDMIRSGEY